MKRIVFLSLVLAQAVTARADSTAPKPELPSPPAADVERYAIPLGEAPQRGPKTAKVTIVEYSDFQCPFCGRVESTLGKVLAKWPKDVRIVWKNFPLPFHQSAAPAARLALAAHKKGRFWEAHKALFEHQRELDEEYLAQLGKQLGVTPPPADGGLQQQVDADVAEGQKFGVRGTPMFFINGRPLSGAQPYESFEAIINEELLGAEKQLRSGVQPARLYETLIAKARTRAETTDGEEPEEDIKIYPISVGQAPSRGPANARVTIVEWSDFQCPFCGRVESTLFRLLQRYPKDVRIVYKHEPLPFHQNAQLAAEAAVEAQAQGKFWELHDELFDHQNELERESLEKWAQKAGLDLVKLKAALDSGKHKARVEEEAKEGFALGARGTPTFFINGRKLIGAQPYETFQKQIEAALRAGK